MGLEKMAGKEHFVDKGGLPVVDVSDNGDVENGLHVVLLSENGRKDTPNKSGIRLKDTLRIARDGYLPDLALALKRA